MIISYQYNFMYFRPKKTGSTTIEEVLSRDLGPDDIISGDRGRRIVRDHGGSANSVDLPAHPRAEAVAKLVSARFWAESYKFASERHPYEKAVSLAYYRLSKQHRKGRQMDDDFASLLDRTVRSGHYRGYDHYSVDGKPVVDDFIRHETLDKDVTRIAARLGISIADELPQRKSSRRLDKRPAREILSDDQKRVVFDNCWEEFELLGYEI
jgi:hypothetical protein